MELNTQRFEVRLAEGAEDIAAAQRLRYTVFVEEMGAPAAAADHVNRLEIDAFDPIFDHLILIDRQRKVTDPRDRVVGVYRLLPGARARQHGGFYGASEYDLSLIEALDRETLELGRSCVMSEYRGGVAMHLMWNALAEYVGARQIEILFGVASFHGTDPDAIAPALSYLHQNCLAPPEIRVRARADGFVHMDRIPADQIDRKSALAQVPALIKAYLRLGGVVGEGAYIDRDFNTIDVCVLMDTTQMVEKYRTFYARGVPAS